MIEIIYDSNNCGLTTQDMKYGDTAIIKTADGTEELILCTYSGFVCLDNPTKTWRKETEMKIIKFVDIEIRVLNIK